MLLSNHFCTRRAENVIPRGNYIRLNHNILKQIKQYKCNYQFWNQERDLDVWEVFWIGIGSGRNNEWMLQKKNES